MPFGALSQNRHHVQVPQRFDATWNVKFGAAILALPYFIIGLVVVTDGTASLIWRAVYGLGAGLSFWGCWRWAHSHCVVASDGVTVVGILRKRRFAADEVCGAVVEVGGVPALALASGRRLRLGFLRALFGPQEQRAEDFAAAVDAVAASR